MDPAPPGPSSADGSSGRRRLVRLILAGGLGALGLTAVAVGLGIGEEDPPAPAALSAAEAAAIDEAALRLQADLGGDPTLARLPLESMDRSAPTRLTISRVGIDTSLMELGLAPDGTLEVPPDDRDAPAGWYRGLSSPGEVGPSVIVGHLDAPDAPAVFYNLGALHAGDVARIVRSDGSVVAYRVTEVATYPRDAFPTNAVYGPSATSVLRLVTCGGAYSQDAGYTHNVVVFADLIGTSSPPEDPPPPSPRNPDPAPVADSIRTLPGPEPDPAPTPAPRVERPAPAAPARQYRPAPQPRREEKPRTVYVEEPAYDPRAYD
ncbi:MAG: class F sortase [Sporichthyaceae bacterium]